MIRDKIAIIGSGISGLAAANKLSKKFDVTIFDKSRGIGGRMATRRVNIDDKDFHFDHGAQFFTAKSEEFKEFCHELLQKEIIAIWQARFAEIDNYKITRKWQFDDHHPHYVSAPQMNNLCKYLSKDLKLILKQEINKITYKNNKWSLSTAENKEFNDFDYLILAIPSHQALNLLPKDFQEIQIIKNAKMIGCFSLMLGFKEKLNLEFEAALVKNSIISWVSNNSSKPQRPINYTLLVNSSNSWAEDNIEEDQEKLQALLIKELSKIINFEQNDILYKSIHRWRYANIKDHTGPKYLFDKNYNLGVCGDFFISGRVENAFLSGLSLSKVF